MKNSTYIRVSPTVSTVKKSHASTPAACERRNWVQLGPLRLGAGPKPCRRRMLRTEVADTFVPSLAHSHRSAGIPNGDSPSPAAKPAPRPQDRGLSGRGAHDDRSIDVAQARDASATASPAS